MNEPNLDDEIREILKDFLDETDYVLEVKPMLSTKAEWFDRPYQSATERLQALISDQVREARINELGRLELRLCKSIQYGIPVVDLQSAIDDRIKELGE